jgi:hypothetical protein
MHHISAIQKWWISVQAKAAAILKPQASSVCAEDFKIARTPAWDERCLLWMAAAYLMTKSPK